MLEELKQEPRWVCWKYEARIGKKTKVPYSPVTRGRASSTDSATWGTYEQAESYLKATDGLDGVGVMLGAGIAGVDIDHCRNPETGELTETAARIVDMLDTYTEISPSGTGVHAIMRVADDFDWPRKREDVIGLEVYTRARYFTVTENVLHAVPVSERTEALTRVCSEYMPKPKPRTDGQRVRAAMTPRTDDAELWDKMFGSGSGDKIRALYNGDLSGHEDNHSAADFALCSHLAFWTGCRADQMDRMFRESSLMRDKWDQRRGSETYGERTIRNAIAQNAKVYSPSSGGSHEARDMTEPIPPTEHEPTDEERARIVPNGPPVFVVSNAEGVHAIADAKGQAVAAPDAADFIAHLDALRLKPQQRPRLILALDGADDAAQGHIDNELNRRNWPHIESGIRGEYETLAEACSADSFEVLCTVGSEVKAAQKVGTPKQEQKKQADQAAKRKAAESLCVELYMTTFTEHIRDARHSRVDTGIYSLNQMLGGGGLYPGLIIIGGRTGSGKTTLALQIGDYIAANGRPVLYVALEMSRDELIAKSIARMCRTTADSMKKQPCETTYADILENEPRNRAIYAQAKSDYFAKVGPKLHVLESIGNQTADGVRRMAEGVELAHGKPPVVIVDYLQIMASPDPHLSDKQAADRNILSMKQLSRDLNTPVIVVSSLNRETSKLAKDAVAEWSFKESGGIEYGADVLLGLERTDQGGKTPVRKVQVRLLKNRRGQESNPIGFDFRPGQCIFTPNTSAVRQMMAMFEANAQTKNGRR